jgi:hypothetical protein
MEEELAMLRAKCERLEERNKLLEEKNRRLKVRVRLLWQRAHKYEQLLWEVGNLPKHE